MKIYFMLLTIVLISGLVTAEESLPILIFKNSGNSYSYCNDKEKCPYMKNIVVRDIISSESAKKTYTIYLLTTILLVGCCMIIILNSVRKTIYPQRRYKIVKA